MANQRIFLTAPGVRPLYLGKRMGYGFYDAPSAEMIEAWYAEVEAQSSGLDVIGVAYECEPVPSSQVENPWPPPRTLTDEESTAWHEWCAARRAEKEATDPKPEPTP
jgi:hypothetical protein